MTIEPLFAWQVEDQDIVLVDGEPVTVVGIVDEDETFLFLFLDKYGDTFEKSFPDAHVFDWVVSEDE